MTDMNVMRMRNKIHWARPFLRGGRGKRRNKNVMRPCKSRKLSALQLKALKEKKMINLYGFLVMNYD